MIKYHNFQITENNGKLNLKNLKTNQEKSVKITYDSDFVFKVQKSQIKTKYQTAADFLSWIQSLIDKNFCTSYISTICKSYIGECDYDFN